MTPIHFVLIVTCSFAVLATANAGRILQRPHLDGRIVGGTAVDIQSVPFQVSLQRNYHFCGGSLIGKHTVLTAAHCTEGSQASNIIVRIGSTHSAKGGRLVNVAEIIRHPKYNPSNIDYDFSILKLKDYKDDGIVTGFAKLPAANEDVTDGTLLTVSGWGNTQSVAESRDSLRAVTVPKFNQEGCNKAYSPYGGVTERMLCAGLPEGGKDACQGDSGGPLFVNNTLVGVVSWGFGCAKPNYPGVYSRVASVREWIATESGV